jgi:predicted RNA-binding Zn-ribbon protein involved in translation (DUF1610 family)
MIQPGHSVAAMVRILVVSIFIQQPSDQREHSDVPAGPWGRCGLEEHRRLDWRPNAPPNNRPPRVIPFILESDSMKNPTRKLRVVEATGLEHTVDAPPILVASSHTIDFLCGNCGTILMHAEDDQVHGLFIHCTQCGACNATVD